MRSRNLIALVFAFVMGGIQLVGCGSGTSQIVISGTLPMGGTVGTAYTGSLTASGGNGNYTWSVTGLPPGVMSSGTSTSTLALAGTPTTAGTFTVAATVSDTKGNVQTSSTTVTIAGATNPISITGTLPATGTVGTAYSGSLTASGGTSPYTWTVTGLPAGVTPSNTSSATVTVSGTPTASGTSAVTATVTDSKGGTANYTVSIVVSATPSKITIGGSFPLTGSVGTTYSGLFLAQGGVAPYTWVVSGLPAGVSPTNGTTSAKYSASGTPTTAASYDFVATVTDSASNTVTYRQVIAISSSSQTVTIGGSFPATGTVGTTYTGSITATGGTAPYTWTVSGLPGGVTATNGTTSPMYSASGTPTTAATYSLSATVMDSASHTATYTQSVVISAASGATFTLSPSSLGALTKGTQVTPITITSSPAGTQPYQWTVSAGTLPAGLLLSNGASTSATSVNSTTNSINITGTPTASGTYSFTLSVQDSASPKGKGSLVFSGTVGGGTTTTACGPPASGTLAPRGNESALTSPFAFILAGADADDNPVTWAGSFTPDGSGGITASDIDVVTGSVAQNYQVQLNGSSYSYGADGRGCLYIAFNQVNGNANPARKVAGHDALPHGKGRQSLKLASGEALANVGTVTFSFSISAPYETGRIEQFDYINSEMQAAGQMHQQTPGDFSLGKLGADYVLGVTGWVVDVPQQEYSRTVMAANINVSEPSGAITSPSADLNIGGTTSGQLSGGAGTFGIVSGSTGRGTGTYTIPYGNGNVTFGFAFYVINSADLYVITDDTPATNAFILSGRALSASPSVTGLNGYYLAAYTGLDTNGSNVDAGNNSVSIGTFQAGATSIVNATVYTNDGGNYTKNTYGVAPYVVQPPNSRMSIANLTEFSPIIYLTNTVTEDDIAGFVVGTDPNTSGGFILFQSSSMPNFSASNLSGGYIFGTSEDIAGISGSNVGQYVFTSGNFTTTTDVVNVTTGPNSMLPNQTISGTVTVTGDGSGTLPANSVSIVTNGGVILGVSNTSQAVQPLLYIWVAQTLVTP